MVSGTIAAISTRLTQLLPPLPLLILIIALHLPALASARTACYAPDGSVFSPDNAPCINVVGVESMCCALNSTGAPDSCAPNGLCIGAGGDQLYWRSSCTDPSWKSPNCLPKTTCDDAAGGTSAGSYPLRLCSDGTWCCGPANQTCCDAHQGFRLAPTLVAIGAAAASTTANSSSNTSCPSSSPPLSNSVAVAVGVGVGVPLALLALAMLGIGFWCGRRRGPRRSAAAAERSGEERKPAETGHFMAGGGGGGSGGENAPTREFHILPEEQNAIYEASGGMRSFELPETSNVEHFRNG